MIFVVLNAMMKPLNVRKKIKEPPNMTTIGSYVMLVLLNVTIEPLNMSKKKGTNKSNKVWSYVILVLLNVRKKEEKRTTKCDNSIVICNVGTVEYDDKTIKYE